VTAAPDRSGLRAKRLEGDTVLDDRARTAEAGSGPARILLALLVALAILVTPLAGSAGVNQWTASKIWGGAPLDVRVDPSAPSTLYAAMAIHGVLKSTDGGASWAPSVSGLPINNNGVLALDIAASAPTTLYLSNHLNNGSVIFKSTDGAASWTSASTGMAALLVRDIAVHPTDPNVVYVAGVFDGVFKTTDGGQTWSAANNGITDAVTTMTIDPSNPSTVYASGNALFKSTDGGSSWTTLASFPSIGGDHLVVRPDNPAILYAAGGLTDLVYESLDGGATWTGLGASFLDGVELLAIDPHTPTHLYAGTRQGMFRWNGSSWSNVSTGIQWDVMESVAFDVVNSGVIYVGTGGGGIYKTVDGAATWQHASTGLQALPMEAVAIDPVDPNKVYAATNGGLTSSTDGGANWSVVMSRVASVAIIVDPSDPATIYSAGVFDGIDKTIDGGATWFEIETGLGLAPQFGALAMDPTDPDVLYGGLVFDKGLFKTVDGGASWTDIEGTLVGNDYYAIAVAPSAPSTVYVGTEIEGIFKSTDAGATWTAVNTGISIGTFSRIDTIAVHPGDANLVYIAANHPIGFGGLVYKTTDGGASWTALAGLGDGVLAIRIDPGDADVLYAATSSNGVYKSRDAGATWSQLNAGLTELRVTDLAIDPLDPARLFATTSSHLTFGQGTIWEIEQRCGNGVLDGSEGCDDGNFVSGDCCSPQCTPEPAFAFCGDGPTQCSAQDSCDGAGTCHPRDLAFGAACGDSGTECTHQDGCDGMGACLDNGFVSVGAPCGDVGTECRNQDTCSGSGTCVDNGFAAAGATCGDGAAVCSGQDTCDGAGGCQLNHDPVGAACGAGPTVCSAADTCNGSGACLDNHLPSGAPCGDPADDCSNQDACNGSAVCLPNHRAAGTACADEGNPCTPDECDGGGVCAHIDTDTDGIGNLCDNCDAVLNPDQEDADCDDPAYFASGACEQDPPPSKAGCCDGGDVCDECPAQKDNDNCDEQAAVGQTVGVGGDTLTTPDGSAQLVIPPGALPAATSISATANGPAGAFTIDRGTTNVVSFSLRPENAAFAAPVTITFQWADRDNDQTVDRGTCIGGVDGGLTCDTDSDCASGDCTVGGGPEEAAMVLKRNGDRFSSSGFATSAYRCDDHQSGACAAAVANCAHPAGTGQASVARCCDRTANTWTFQTCDFSEFFLGLTSGDLVPGKGDPATDCMAEWGVRNPLNDPWLDRKGLTNFKQECTDGDPTCDLDGSANGVCAVDVTVCLNVPDVRLVDPDTSLPACTPGSIGSWQLKKPFPDSIKPFEAPNAVALRDAVAALAANTISGSHQEVVTFGAPLATAETCTAPVRVQVPLKAPGKKGKAVFKMQVRSGTTKDTDKIVVRCFPATP
jgi:photosystem II stability/assembly factor-like uncharacterized protein